MTFVKVSKERIFSSLKVLVPYLFLLALTMLPLYLFFENSGLPWGDDAYWHRLELADLAYGFEEGFRGLSTGHGFLGFTAVDIYGFYGPFLDYFVVILYEMFKGVGATLIGTLKFALVLFCFLSNAFVYLLARKASGRSQLGLLIAALYNFLPYKMFCILGRAAYQEAVALCFVPLIFYALYRILHDASFKVGPYVLLGLSAACLVLTHPITALFTAASGVLFLCFNCLALWKVFHDWRRLVSFVVTLVLTVGLVSPYVFTALANAQSGFYIVSDPELMWTSFEWLTVKAQLSTSYSGFLNWGWLEANSGGPYQLAQKACYSLICFFVSGLVTLLVDAWLKPYEKANYWRYPLDAALLFAPAALFQVRLQFYLALGVFFLFLLLSDFPLEKKPLNEISRLSPRDSLKDPTLYFLLFSLIISAILIYLPSSWKALPSAFYNIQFPYRLWGLFGFFAVCLVLYGMRYLCEKRWALNSLAFIAALLFCLCGTPYQTEIELNRKQLTYYADATEEEVLQTTGIGWSNDYLPQYYEQDSDYESAYPNSFYYVIKDHLYAKNKDDQSTKAEPFPSGAENYYPPVFLEGKGSSAVTALKSPEVTFDLTLTSETALVQIPQFYYDGYAIDVRSLSDDSVQSVTPEEVDGLVAFRVQGQGSYQVQVTFPGPTTYRVGRVFFYLSIVGFVGLGSWGYYETNFRSKKKKEKETASLSANER
jgi:hypothetical protein